MFDDFDLPGLDDLIDLIADLADVLDLNGDDMVDFDQPMIPIWDHGGLPADLSSSEAFWGGLLDQPLDTDGFVGEFGNMHLFNPFGNHATNSPIEHGSYDDLVVRTSLNSGIPLGDLPN